ncbi:unnamed protein product [Calypogeia fissa]
MGGHLISKELSESEAMRLSWSPCSPENAVLSQDFCLSNLPVYLSRTSGSAASLGSSLLSVRWNLTRQVHEPGQIKRSIGGMCVSFASTQSPNQSGAPSERSFWPSLIPRPPIYSSNFADVDPIQLSELWLQTLKVRRDPEKIIKALRHSFAFVVVLTEDEDVPSTSGTRWKTVGVGRAVSDGTFIATICDVAVDPAYRHRGIGRRIVKKLVENMKRTGGPSGFAVFPPPVARRFFWMIGFRSDKKYKLMAYREKEDDKISGADRIACTGNGDISPEAE